MNTLLEILGTTVGLVYIYLEYRASIWLWITGIVMPAIYIVVYYNAGLYADLGLNVYYLLAAVYGFCAWKFFGKETNKKDEMPVTRCPRQTWLPQLSIFLLCFGVLYLVLKYCTDSTVPIGDSFINALSVIGLWQLSRKYIEQWIIWIVVDTLSAGLYLYKGMLTTPWLYLLYAIIAIFGYYKWKRMMNYSLS